MPAGAFTLYSNAVLGITRAQINLSADAFVCTLINNSYVPAANTDTLWSSVSANELPTGSGYTVGGLILLSQTNTLTAATVTFNAASPTWPNFSAGPFRYAVICRRNGSALLAGDLLLCYSDLTGSGSVTGAGGSYTITVSGSGIFQITHTP